MGIFNKHNKKVAVDYDAGVITADGGIDIEVNGNPSSGVEIPTPNSKDAANPFVKEKHMIGYKAFGKNWTNRDYTYSPTEVNTYEGEVKLCQSGFHFCKDLRSVFGFVDLDDIHHLAMVEAWTDLQGVDHDKTVARNLKVLHEIPLTSDEFIEYCLSHKMESMLHKINLSKSSEVEKQKLSDLNYCVGDFENFHAEDVHNVYKDYLDERLTRFYKSPKFFDMLTRIKQAAANGQNSIFFDLYKLDIDLTQSDLDTIFVDDLGYKTIYDGYNYQLSNGSISKHLSLTISF